MKANTANVVTARTERVMHAGLYTAKAGNTEEREDASEVHKRENVPVTWKMEA